MNIINKLLEDFTNKKGGINTKKIRMLDNQIYLDALLEATYFLPEDTHLRFRFNYIKEGYVNTPKLCKTCNESVLINVYSSYCSRKCSNGSELVTNKMKKKWKDKSLADVKEIQDKRRSTNLEKYGVDIASKLPEVIEKNKQTHIQNWGDYAMRNKDVSNRRNATCIDKYGGVGMASPVLFAKMKNSNVEKYGVEYYSSTKDWYDKCRETVLTKYGEEWISKVDYINAKQQSGGYSYYDFEFPSGKVIRVQGYEPKVLTKLLGDYNEDDIVVGVQNIINEIGFFHYEYENIKHRYYPDIYIKTENQVIEVKSTYTFNKEKEKNLLKRDSVLNKNINFKFVIL